MTQISVRVQSELVSESREVPEDTKVDSDLALDLEDSDSHPDPPARKVRGGGTELSNHKSQAPQNPGFAPDDTLQP